MLSLARGTSRRAASLKPLSRAFAQEASTPIPISQVQPAVVDASSAWRKGKIPVREDHGLYAFFRRKQGTKETGEDAYETVESPKKEVSGRAWKASELRLKSFKDLHTLWYVTLRERNLLASQKEEARKAGIKIGLVAQSTMAGHCRKTMARIKVVMNERRLAYEGAVKLFKEHQELVQDKQLLKLHREAFTQAHARLTEFVSVGRKLQRTNRRKLLKAKAKLEAEGILPPASTAEAAPTSEATAATATTAETVVEAKEAAAAPTTTTAASEKAKEEEVLAGAEPKSAVDTAAAGLFGESVKSKQ